MIHARNFKNWKEGGRILNSLIFHLISYRYTSLPASIAETNFRCKVFQVPPWEIFAIIIMEKSKQSRDLYRYKQQIQFLSDDQSAALFAFEPE